MPRFSDHKSGSRDGISRSRSPGYPTSVGPRFEYARETIRNTQVVPGVAPRVVRGANQTAQLARSRNRATKTRCTGIPHATCPIYPGISCNTAAAKFICPPLAHGTSTNPRHLRHGPQIGAIQRSLPKADERGIRGCSCCLSDINAGFDSSFCQKRDAPPSSEPPTSPCRTVVPL